MRRWSILPLLAVAAGLVCLALTQACSPQSPPRDAASPPGGSAPAAPAPQAGTGSSDPGPAPAPTPSGPSIVLSPDIPADVTVGNDVSLPGLQDDFDVFSWNSFIALAWPPGPGGGGDPAKKPGEGPSGDNPTVWEGWKNVDGIFLPDGKTPAWDARAEIPPACRGLYQPGVKFLQQIGKVPDLLTATVQPFDTGPLIDQNGAYARFEIVVNRNMFDYILGNTLYSKAGQQAFSGTVKFPCGANGTSQVGAIMVKAAWKVMGKGDDPARFHTTRALVYTPASSNPPVTQSCTLQTVGLAGLHVAHKSQSAPQWVWSTFEQVDNDPDESQVGPSGHPSLAAHYSFYDPACKDCPVNEPPPRPWIPNQPGMPSQVVRRKMLPDFALESARARNADARALLAGVNPKSVWQYYELISTQWPTDPGPGNCDASPTDPDGNPAPQFLANTTLETYVQGTTPNVSSSCIECHGNAAMTTGGASDFTYTLQLAR